MIILVHLLTDQMVPELVAQALLVLFQVIGNPHISDEEKLLPIDLIGRLARIPTGELDFKFPKTLTSRLKVLECINIQV